MVRLAAAGGVVKLDLPQRASGRGGYVHQREECLHKLVHSKVKEFRSLQRRIGLDERRQIAELIRTRLDRNETLA